MARLVTGVALIAALFISTSAASYAQELTDPITISPGFATLLETGRRTVGVPLASERSGDTDGSTLVPTSTGVLYWEPGVGPSWTNGFDRLTLDNAGELVEWQSLDAIAPPPPEPQYFTASVMSAPSYIASHSRYGQRAVCVSDIETGHWTAYWNPQGWPPPYYREHAQGYFGWLPSTFYSVAPGSARIMNLDDEIRAFDTMLDRHRGSEFAGIAWGRC